MENGPPGRPGGVCDLLPFLTALGHLPTGHSLGEYAGRRWGVTFSVSADGRRRWLYGEELGGVDRVSFNLYLLGGRPVLKPCEMPADKVIAFVLGYRPMGQVASG